MNIPLQMISLLNESTIYSNLIVQVIIISKCNIWKEINKIHFLTRVFLIRVFLIMGQVHCNGSLSIYKFIRSESLDQGEGTCTG